MGAPGGERRGGEAGAEVHHREVVAKLATQAAARLGVPEA